MRFENPMPSNLSVGLDDLVQPATAKQYEKSGCLQIEKFLPQQKVQDLHKQFCETYQARRDAGDFERVGDKRFMVSVPVSNGFDDPAVYCPPELTVLLSRLLGNEFLLSCFSCVVSHPGALSQHLHRDYGGLFEGPFDVFAPSFAINLFIPLVDLNERTGTTRLWPGSHRKPDSPDHHDEGGDIHPYLTRGTALLMDYRLLHEGTPNTSDEIRPILCLAFTRNWFLDSRHFKGVNPLMIEPDVLQKMDEDQRRLFSRAGIYSNVAAER